MTLILRMRAQPRMQYVWRIVPFQQPVDDRDEKEGEKCRYQQPADYRPSKRRILLTAIAETQGHREHAKDHGQRGHYHRAQPRKACGKRCIEWNFSLIAKLLISKRHH